MSTVYLWLAFIFVCWLQIIPLPQFVVALLSPTSFDLFYSVSAESYYLSIDPGQSMVSFIKLLSFFCLFVCVLSLVNTEKRIRMLLLTVMIAGTLQAAYGSLEILFNVSESLIFEFPVKEEATGSFLYNNHYANFLLMSLAAAIGLVVTSLEKSKVNSSADNKKTFVNILLNNKAIVHVCIAIMLLGLLLSRSGIGNAAFYSAIAVVGAIAFVLIRNRSKGLTVLVVSIFIVDLFIVSGYFGLERVKDRVAQTSIVQETSSDVLHEAFPIIADFPLFGSGAGSFYSTFPSYQQSETLAFHDHLHNDYLQLLFEYGIVGSFILFIIFLFCVFKSMRAMYIRRNSIFKGSGFACLLVLLGMSINMSVNIPLQAYANASYFVVFLSLSMVINTLKLREP